MLGLSYSIDFIDSRTIEINVVFDNPLFVSANKPEDVLVILFNGPIFDQEDGLEMEIDFRELRREIPP